MIRHILPLRSNIYWWYNHDPHINITVMYQHAVCVKYNSDIKFHSTHSLYDSNNHDYDMGCRIVALYSGLRVKHACAFGHRWVWTTMSHPEKNVGLDMVLMALWPHIACNMLHVFIPCGTVRYRTPQYGTVRYRTVPLNTVRGTVRYHTRRAPNSVRVGW